MATEPDSPAETNGSGVCSTSTSPPGILFSLYLDMFRNTGRAFRYPAQAIEVRNSPRPTLRACVDSYLRHLERVGDDSLLDLLALLDEDIEYLQPERMSRRARPTIVETNGQDGHVRHVKVIACLGIDGHFDVRVPDDGCILVDNPTDRETHAIKETLYQLLWVRSLDYSMHH